MNRRRLAGEAGFSIIEVLTAMTVGLVVLAAALVVIQWATQLTTSTQDRVDATQRGRHGMERVLTTLRSTVCVTPADGSGLRNPMIAGSSTRAEIYANLGAPNALPQRRVLTYDATKRAIVEQSYQGVETPGGLPVGLPVMPIGGTATTRTLVENVVPDDGTPIFRYYTYELDNGAGGPAAIKKLLSSPVPAADLNKVLEVQVSFRARPLGATADSPKDAIFKSAAYVRIGDPLDPAKGVTCT